MSESEEMYLITIAHLKEQGLEGPVPLSRIAEDLSVVPVSANQMVKKLAAMGLVQYVPYKGVYLTSAGKEKAARVLRHRRLWETFLIDQLGLEFIEADALACGMEHITTDHVADRLSTFLGDPDFTPGGRPIPGSSEEPDRDATFTLADLEVGRKGIIKGIQSNSEIQHFLAAEGLHRGHEVIVLVRGANGSVLIESQDRQISLSHEITPLVRVQAANGEKP